METLETRIGFDLDGVIVGKPFFIPKKFLEWLVRFHKNGTKKYRFPKSKLEIFIRKLSHHWFLRPLLRKNFKVIKKFSEKEGVKLYIVSGRYSFLKDRTDSLIKKHSLDKIFAEIFTNCNNEQPHLFKEKMVKKLNLDFLFDDDPIIIDYLKKIIKDKKFYLVSDIYGKSIKEAEI